MNRFLPHAVFLAGLAVVAWVGAGYAPANPLALAVTLLVAAVYLAGALELHRVRRATRGLAGAVAALPASPPELLTPWLETVPAGLRNAVRRRIEGEPVGLPGPAMAPYLSGLLVLLGMLGTFAGMVMTLRGTGAALERVDDLSAVRDTLIAPVKGLGFAFGTSVAGVAASAALGLMSALARRERALAGQALDTRIAGPLRRFSAPYQREQSLALLQQQAGLVPALVDSLQAAMAAMQGQAQTSGERLLASQERFHAQAESAYTGLAASVERSLQASLAEGARMAGQTLGPVAESAMQGIVRETAALQATLAATARSQHDELATRFEAGALGAAQAWQDAMARHERGAETLSRQLAEAVAGLSATFEQRSAALLDALALRQSAWQGEMAEAAVRLQAEAASAQQRLAAGADALLEGAAQRQAAWQGELSDSLARHERVGTEVAGQTREALADTVAAFERHGAGLLRTIADAHAGLQAAAAARDEQALATMGRTVEAMAASLREEWTAAGAQAIAQQQRLGDAMERTARDITAQADAQARGTLAEIARLMQAAAEAPRAAAEVVAELRQKLSDSMARDNALLEERGRILETLGTLLDAVSQAAGEQRGAIDALVASSGALLERVGARFGEQVDVQSAKLESSAAQITGSAAEVASLGEAFGLGVQLHSQANEKLLAQLQRIEGALSKSMTRSDEQLAYYVAQAREVVDLSMLSQRQILEDLQRHAARPAEDKAAAR